MLPISMSSDCESRRTADACTPAMVTVLGALRSPGAIVTETAAGFSPGRIKAAPGPTVKVNGRVR